MEQYNSSKYGEDFFVLTSENCPERLSAFYGYFYNEDTISIRANPVRLLDWENAGIFVNLQTINDKVVIQQDFFCSFGLYLFRDREYWAVSNSFYLLVRFLSDKFQLTVNDEYLALFMADMVPVSVTETAIMEIKELAQGEFIVIDSRTKELATERQVQELACVDIFSRDGLRLIDEWHVRHSRILQAIIKAGFVLSSDLSGGFDSRAAFSCLFRPDLYKHVHVYAPDDEIHTHADDFRIASKIASIYGFPLKKFKAAYKRLSPLEAILNSLKTKFFFHTQFYFKGYCYLRPVFNLNGGAGEVFRAMPAWSGEDFINIAAPKNPILGKDINQEVRNILRRSWNLIKSRYSEPISDAVKIYRYTRVKNHFGRTGVESFLCNLISIAPFMDPCLYKLNLIPPGVTDRNTFFAFIYGRFMPEILELPFDKGRKLEATTIQLVKSLTREFPWHAQVENRGFTIQFKEKIFSQEYSLPMADSATRYFGEIYKSAEVVEFVQAKFGEDVHAQVQKSFDAESYWGFWQPARLLTEYFLHGIIHKREGFHYPYSQLYLPHALLGAHSHLSEFVKKASLQLKIRNIKDLYTPAVCDTNNLAVSSDCYFDMVIDTFPWSRSLFFKNKGIVELLLAASANFFPDVPPYMVDIIKIAIFSRSGNRILFEASNIFCVGKNPYRISFPHDKDEEIIITVVARTNALWLYSWMDESRTFMEQAFANLPAKADNISNQYNH